MEATSSTESKSVIRKLATSSEDGYFWFYAWDKDNINYGVKLETVILVNEPTNPNWGRKLDRVIKEIKISGASVKKFTFVARVEDIMANENGLQIKLELPKLFHGDFIKSFLVLSIKNITPEDASGKMGVKIGCIVKRVDNPH